MPARGRSGTQAPALAAVLLMAAGCGAETRSPPKGPPVFVEAEPRIVTPSEATTESELRARGARAEADLRWDVAVDAFDALHRAVPEGSHAAEDLFNLALSLEGLKDRPRARDAFLELARRFPDRPTATVALVRVASLDAYLEDWSGLTAIGDALMARNALDPIETVVAFGSRGLGRVELGQDAAASKDILDGLEVADGLHYGARDVLPVAVAQLYFALGELRRIRSERLTFEDLPHDFKDADFLEKLEARCGGLLDAQDAFAKAVRSVDPRWAEMAGLRIGQMYRALHDALMQISPPSSKTTREEQVFYAFMHIRYRVLLEKGLREIDQTIALAERTNDSSAWVDQAREVRQAMRAALDDEKKRIAAMPFTEDEVKKALELMTLRAQRAKR